MLISEPSRQSLEEEVRRAAEAAEAAELEQFPKAEEILNQSMTVESKISIKNFWHFFFAMANEMISLKSIKSIKSK